MSEEENTTGDDSQFSVGDALTTVVGLFAGMIVILSLYIGLSDVPFGIQIATVITYTGVVYWMTFFRTRGFNTGFSVQDEAVKEKLPRLLAIHGAFVVLIVSLQTAAFAAGPHLSAYWFTEHGPKHDSAFRDVLGLICILIGIVQILISRGILTRSVEAYKKKESPETFRASK